jgi:hypothetical protein
VKGEIRGEDLDGDIKEQIHRLGCIGMELIQGDGDGRGYR